MATRVTTEVVLVPLRNWLEIEAAAKPSSIDRSNSSKESFIRRTTVAYGIAELLKRTDVSKIDEYARIDNIVVFLSKNEARPGEGIKGIGMISPGLTLKIEEPSYLNFFLEGDGRNGNEWGRCLEVELDNTSSVLPRVNLAEQLTANQIVLPQNNNLAALADAALADAALATAAAEEECESNRCYLFARLLHELLLNEPLPNTNNDVRYSASDGTSPTVEPAQKRPRKKAMLSRAKGDYDRAELTFQIPSVIRMQSMGIPASLCRMMHNLLECVSRGDDGDGAQQMHYDVYKSFGGVIDDLHLLLLDPPRFLFDAEGLIGNSSNMRLLYRKGKLYGRDKEETLITDAFCRVSRGQSEAFFIGGFSGSGKSMLVNSLRERVNVVGGYVIKHKFDAISQERPLSGVISAFNQICQMIKDRHTPRRLSEISKKLRDEFGVDFGLLVRLLPSVSVLLPDFVGPGLVEQDGDTMNVRSVCYSLLRFVRVVSSPVHPIMLFLDDIQWADSTVLDLIHTILSDTMGSCMFFVGTYRDNEVQVDHAVFNLMEKLDISKVRTTKVSLTGLCREDLNTMISDALCLYPRICMPLSDIVFQKTKGSPFFVLEFMQSLMSRSLLQYNIHQKRWVWNEDIIRAEEITDNVLHLLSTKMNRLDELQVMVLKVMACFGTRTDESVIGYLSESTEYSGIRDGLEGAISDGFIEKDSDGNFKFSHDKIREAAYNLIPDSEKKQFHYNLGKELLSVCEGKDVGNTVILIANQMVYGKEFIQQDNEEVVIAVADLNMRAGKKAMDGCDHKTAYCYLQVALAMLPDNHWERYYDLSLRLHFLVASAANSNLKEEESELILNKILANARCIEDKLPSYFLLCQLFLAQGKANEAYNTCSSTLTKLGESIPDTLDPEDVKRMIIETINTYKQVCGDNDDWLKRKEMASNNRTIERFYNLIVATSYRYVPNRNRKIMLAYFCCKGFQLSLKNGICQHTPLAALLFALVSMNEENAAVLCRMAKNTMSLLHRFDVRDQIPTIYYCYYGMMAWRFEHLQVCTSFLRRGVESGLSSGNPTDGIHCAMQVIKGSFFGGENLLSVLKEIDYFLHLIGSYSQAGARNYALNFRETVSTLIDRGITTGIEARYSSPSDTNLEPFFLVHKAIRMYWLGYSERCNHFMEQSLEMIGSSGKYNSYVMKFYHGLNSLDMVKKKKKAIKSKDAALKAMAATKGIASSSEWNFAGKYHLLEAEVLAVEMKHCHGNFTASQFASHHSIMALYDSSIAHAKQSRFIHEEGLACEKAGLYCKKVQNYVGARNYFNRAHMCYLEWGSSVKVEFIQNELNSLLN